MKRDEIIKKTDECLKCLPDIKNRMTYLDTVLKNDSYDKDTIEKFKEERLSLNKRLSEIISSVSVLNEIDQKIICLKYFDKLSYRQIEREINLSKTGICYRMENSIFTIGKAMFGFDDDLYKKINEYSI